MAPCVLSYRLWWSSILTVGSLTELSSIPSSEQAHLGEMLAQMHLAPAPAGQQFGFPVPTCCGATEQDNTPERNWADFFGKRRIGDMCERIGDKELSRLGSEVQTR